MKPMLLALALLWLNLPAHAVAQAYPSRPIHLIVPAPPGGGSDVVARIVAQKLGEIWKQTIVIENVSGADTQLGALRVAKAAPDGYSIGIVSPAFAINKALYPNALYDADRDFTPIAQLCATPMILGVGSALGVRSLRELIGLSAARSGTLNYSTSSSTTLVYGEIFKSATGIRAEYVPYKGSAPSVMATATGEVTYTLDTLNAMKPFIDSGKLIPLTVLSASRFHGLPAVPTAREAGLPQLDMAAYWGIMGPAKIPPDVVATLSEGLRQALEDPSVAQKLRAMGNQPDFADHRQFATFLAAEFERYGRIVEANNLRNRK